MFIRNPAIDILLILGIPCVATAIIASVYLIILDIKDLITYRKNTNKYKEIVNRWED